MHPGPHPAQRPLLRAHGPCVGQAACSPGASCAWEGQAGVWSANGPCMNLQAYPRCVEPGVVFCMRTNPLQGRGAWCGQGTKWEDIVSNSGRHPAHCAELYAHGPVGPSLCGSGRMQVRKKDGIGSVAVVLHPGLHLAEHALLRSDRSSRCEGISWAACSQPCFRADGPASRCCMAREGRGQGNKDRFWILYIIHSNMLFSVQNGFV